VKEIVRILNKGILMQEVAPLLVETFFLDAFSLGGWIFHLSFSACFNV